MPFSVGSRCCTARDFTYSMLYNLRRHVLTRVRVEALEDDLVGVTGRPVALVPGAHGPGHDGQAQYLSAKGRGGAGQAADAVGDEMGAGSGQMQHVAQDEAFHPRHATILTLRSHGFGDDAAQDVRSVCLRYGEHVRVEGLDGGTPSEGDALAENNQLLAKEAVDLVRTYYGIPEKSRSHLLSLAKTLAA